MILKPKAIGCDTARSLILDYLDGALSEADTMRFEAHIKDCEACRSELADQRRMLELVKASAYSVPAGLHESVMNKIADIPQENVSRTKAIRFKPWMGALTAACAALMILVVGRGYLNPKLEDAPMNDEPVGEHLRIDENEPEPMGPYDNAKLADNAEALSGETEAFDYALENLSSVQSAVLICRKSDVESMISGEVAGSFILENAKYERYTVSNDAMAVFTEYIELFEDNLIDYRAALPENTQFDVCEIYLLISGED